MIARTHDLAAITLLAAVVLSQPLRAVTLSTAIVAVVANQIGGIAPDIDQPTAPFWRNLPIGGVFGRLIGRMMGGHRFLSHSVLGLFLFGFATHWLLEFMQPIMPRVDIGLVWWAFMIGMVSHLVMDSFTKEGVPWLLPIPWKFGFPPVRHFRVTTGKNVERFIVLPGLILIAIWLFASNYVEISTFVNQYIRR
jgi:inner membrane protein